MKLELLQSDFAAAIQKATRLTSTKSLLPMLQNLLLKTDKNKLIIKATNLESAITTSVGAKVEKEGVITVPAKTLASIVSNLGQTKISIETKSETLFLSSENFSSKIAGTNATDFPSIPELINKEFINIPQSSLTEALSYTLISTSLDDTRPTLTGVLFSFGESISLVATDGFRLSKKTIQIKKGTTPLNLIIPKPILAELVKLSTKDKSISIEYNKSDNQLLFAFDNTLLTSKIIDGQFPDYEKIIPTSHQTKIFINKKDLQKAIKLASVFANESSMAIALKADDGGLSITSENSQSGDQKSVLEAKIEGAPIEISFNYKFIEDFLNAVKGEEILLELLNPISPAIFKDISDENFLHLIMPIKPQNSNS